MTLRGFLAFVAAALWVFFLAGEAVRAEERQAPSSWQQIQLSFAPVVDRAAPAVVNIYSRRKVQTRGMSPLFDDPFFRRFFGDQFSFGVPRERIQNALGSGVIVDADGVIVTNHHVVGGADEIRVVLADRREFDAKLLGSDEKSDLAVLRIDTEGDKLPTIGFRDSDDVHVGDLVLAIGNPFGVGQTVTSGIVSALARTQAGISDFNLFIQTDAAINPGNSGGALVDINGRLIGINTAIFSKSGGSLGIGFAVPSNMVRSVLAGIVNTGHLVRPWFGAWGRQVTADIANSLGLDRPVGVLIEDVYRDGPAAAAGIRIGDVILKVDGQTVDHPEALDYRLATLPVGDRTSIEVWRKGRLRTLTLSLVTAPEDPPRQTTELAGRHPLDGAVVANLSPALAEELRIKRFQPGVIVLAMKRGSTAGRVGFSRGDRILKVNGRAVASVGELKAELGSRAGRWRITLDRDGRVINWDFR
ncbi:MAG: DegQ family serine endoprotease [Rhodospirillales bacterium]|nr:DegQ family serine endoprotease [Rhodospirillales bacterium]